MIKKIITVRWIPKIIEIINSFSHIQPPIPNKIERDNNKKSKGHLYEGHKTNSSVHEGMYITEKATYIAVFHNSHIL